MKTYATEAQLRDETRRQLIVMMGERWSEFMANLIFAVGIDMADNQGVILNGRRLNDTELRNMLNTDYFRNAQLNFDLNDPILWTDGD